MIVLDTHALVWWVAGDAALSPRAAQAIEGEREGGRLIVSSISAWEVAMLVDRKRLVLSMDPQRWLARVAEIAGLRFEPVDNDIAVESVALPGTFHKDPADRIIVATARKFAADVVTADDKMHAYPYIRTIW